jgi:hypothetical protein
MRQVALCCQQKKMKTTDKNQLLDRLENDTRAIILRTNYLLQEDPGLLLQQPAPGQWSVAQVTEHLNTYGRYYLPLLQKALGKARVSKGGRYKPGWLGDYFTKMMLPKEGLVRNKMKAFKNHRPSPDIDSKKVLDEFLQQEQLLLTLLAESRNLDIASVRIPISIASFIRLKAGDTFRFVIAHHQRHFVQIENTLRAVKKG